MLAIHFFQLFCHARYHCFFLLQLTVPYLRHPAVVAFALGLLDDLIIVANTEVNTDDDRATFVAALKEVL